MAPKRALVLVTGDGGGQHGKRMRMTVPGAAGGGGGPASPGARLLRQTVLALLFLMRMKVTATESISQIGHMVQKLHRVQSIIIRKLDRLQERMESIGHEVKQLARLHSNCRVDQHLRLELNQAYPAATGSNTNIQLRFLNDLKTPIYTEKNITAKSNAAIKIGIFEGGNMITDGPLSKLKVEILVLRGDFSNDGRVSWTEDEFNNHIVQGRDGQGFVLGGDCSAWLKNGEGSFSRIRFKEGSSRTRSRKFILGARVCKSENNRFRVQEAVMKPVAVLDRRNEANEKRYPPNLGDEVFRLEEIAKDGTYHKRLQKANIFTVHDFLKALNKNAKNLNEKVLQMKKHHSSWEKMIGHARGCCLKDRHELKAYKNEEGNVMLFFNCVHQLVGAAFHGDYVTYGNFGPAQKALVNQLEDYARGIPEDILFDYVMKNNIPEPVCTSSCAFAGPSNPSGPEMTHQGTEAAENLCQNDAYCVPEPLPARIEEQDPLCPTNFYGSFDGGNIGSAYFNGFEQYNHFPVECDAAAQPSYPEHGQQPSSVAYLGSWDFINFQ